MASNDVITKADIEGLKVYIDGRIVELEKKFDAKVDELKTEINILERKVEFNATKIDMPLSDYSFYCDGSDGWICCNDTDSCADNTGTFQE